jgi:ABC transporter substrate binding protein
MNRRAFVTGLGAALAAPLGVEAQQSDRVYRLGLLDTSSPDAGRQSWWDAFRQQMRAIGYVEGQNLVLERRWGEGDDDRLRKRAVELVALNVDVLVTGGINAAFAAKRATSRIPIVMATGADPVALGLVASLRQPGGNITGMTSIQPDLAGKRLELIRMIAPSAVRVGVLWDEGSPGSRVVVNETEVAARAIRLTIRRLLSAALRLLTKRSPPQRVRARMRSTSSIARCCSRIANGSRSSRSGTGCRPSSVRVSTSKPVAS